MLSKSRVKYYLKKVLETPLLGRPVRKILWTIFRLTRKLHAKTAKIYSKHPYVKKLARIEKQAQIESLGQFKTINTFGGRLHPDIIFMKYYKSLTAVQSSYPCTPLISILLPVYKVKHSYFKEALASIALQSYENWELCVVDDASNDPAINEMIKWFSVKFPGKVKWSVNKQNSHICITSNSCLSLATGDYIALMDHDDRLLPNALAEMVRFINLHGEPDILYSDETTIDKDGFPIHTYHKPAWSPLMHLTVNYTTHLSLYRRNLIEQIGGFRVGFEGSQDHDLMLRACEATERNVVHVPLTLYQWRAHFGSTAFESSAKPYAAIAGERAVKEACMRRGWPAEVVYDDVTHYYRVNFSVKNTPKVSIIIPNKDSPELIAKCLHSVFTLTTYEHIEVVIVDHESQDQATLAIYQQYANQQPERFKTIRFQGRFNFNKMNNVGAAAANGEYLVLLNNDTEVITTTWIEQLLGVAQLPEVGAVGCKLLYPDNKIQHAGLMGHGFHIARHAGHGLDEDTSVYYNYLQTMHEVIGVTAACLMIAKKKYLAVGGMIESFVPNGFGDVDFCLSLGMQNLGHADFLTLREKLAGGRSP